MTTVDFTIGGVDYADYVIQADTWRESLTGIGRWEAILDPRANNWLGVFAVDQVMTINIDGIRMMEGYLDAAKPFLDRRGVFTDLYHLQGRDYGLDLALLYITADYRNMRADDIVQAALITSGGEIRFGSPSAAAFVDYEFNRTFMATGVRDLAQLVGYDFFVNNTMIVGPPPIVAMNFFPVGDPLQHTTVDLVSDVGSLTNNILDFDMGETDGFDLANRVEAIAGELNNHWTTFNAADWVGNWCNVTDELVVFLHRASLLALVPAGPVQPSIDLTFPRYDHTVLDMSESGNGKYDYWMHDTINGIKRLRIRLRDVNNNEIEFYQGNLWGLTKCYQCTDQPDNDEWRKVTFPIGEESGIEAAITAGSNKGHWYEFNVPAGPFDWSQVNRIRFTTTGVNLAVWDYFILDGLGFSNIEVISIATDPTPIGGTRMLPVYRSDIKSQVELDAFAAWKLTRTQDPLENIQIVAIGQTGNPYAAQSLDIRIAPYIPVLTPYRIFEVHHQVVKSSDESLEPGYTYITEYNLIRNNLTGGGPQFITPEKALFPISPIKADLRKKRNKFYALDRQNLP